MDDLLAGRGNNDADAKFRYLENTYGATLVKDAMLHTLVAIFIHQGVMSKSDFVDGLEFRLKTEDEARARAAGMAD